MKKITYFLPALAALAIVVGLVFVQKAEANPFYSGTKARSAIATSSATYLPAGAATSTIIYDSYEAGGTNQANGGNLTIPDSVAILLRGTASSTATIVNAACEYSEDTIDWYQSEVGSTPTTTGPFNIGLPYTFTFTYASSTVGGAGLTSNNSAIQKVFNCPVPLRYVRVVVTTQGNNATIWTAIVPKKQRN